MVHTDLIAPIPELLRRHAAEHPGKVAYRDSHSAVMRSAIASAVAAALGRGRLLKRGRRGALCAHRFGNHPLRGPDRTGATTARNALAG